MRSVRSWFVRLGELVFRHRRDLELAAEMESHVQMHTEAGVQSGLAPDEARRQALIALGGVEQTKESYRDRRGFPALEATIQDTRFGLRMLWKNPGFTAVAVLTLALGIGANTAVFSIVDAVLLEPLPYKDPARLVHVATTFKQGISISNTSPPDYRDWRDRNKVFTAMAAFTDGNLDAALPGEEPERLYGGVVTSNLFPLLGVNPILGRAFLPEEEQWGHDKVVILSYGLWKARFGGDQNVVGRSIHLQGLKYLIVGIMPGALPLVNFPTPVDLWVPLAYEPDDLLNKRANHYLDVIARMKPGVKIAQAQAEMSRITGQLETEFPENKGVSASVRPLRDRIVGGVRSGLLILLGAVSFVLLIACVNVANLMLARATSRGQEFAIRSALGASRRRLLAQSFMESLPLAFLGGVCALLLAAVGLKFLASLIPSNFPKLAPIALNTTVLFFTALISLLTTISFVLVQAIRPSEAAIEQKLREGRRSGNVGPARRGLQSYLVIAEVSLALLLLSGAGLLIKTLVMLGRINPGFSSDHLLTMLVPLSLTEFPYPRQDGAVQFYQELVARVDALPGVRDTALTTTLPLGVGSDMGKWIDIQSHAPPTSLDKVPIVQLQLSSPRYLPSIGVRLVEGRFFTDQDNQHAPSVAIINETFAWQFFPNEDPIGKTIRTLPPVSLLPPDIAVSNQLAPFRTIVGVIGDMRDGPWISHAILPTVYLPHFQYVNEAGVQNMILVVRTTGDPLALSASVRDLIRSLRPNQPVAEVATMEQHLGNSLSPERFSMLLFSIFAGLALVLSAVGIYGVMAYTVLQRTHEIGVRMALGAERGQILRLIVRQGANLGVVGIAIGLAAALGLTRLMRNLLYDVSPTDPLTFAGVAILLMAVALVACYIPARRATRVDPMVALRHE